MADAPHTLTGGFAVLRDNSTNKDSAFTHEERSRMGLRGFYPYKVESFDEQIARIKEQMQGMDDLNKHIYLNDLCDRNQTLFYRYIMDNIKTSVPLVYTPIVGKSCQLYGHIVRRYRGLFINKYDKGHIEEILRNWPRKNVKAIVITDGERILGLGDQGVNGMGIPVGKLQLYTCCAGLHPDQCLPMTLDVGTNRETFWTDPLYDGIKEPRIRGKEYDELIEEFLEAVVKVFGKECLVQWEDFANINAFRVLCKHREKYLTFNDDIQGTAATALAGVLSAMKVNKEKLSHQRIVFFGSGMAGVGIANALLTAIQQFEGVPKEVAAKNFWMINDQGLLTETKLKEQGLATLMAPFIIPARPDSEYSNKLIDVVRTAKPSILIGCSGQGGQFTQEVIEAMVQINGSRRPVIFALSNPTANSECTAQQAWEWSKERALFGSGSPYPAYVAKHEKAGVTLVPSQCNNMYIFPALGLACVAVQSKCVPDELFMTAASALADCVSEEELQTDSLFPRIERIREVSIKIAIKVSEKAFEMGLARIDKPEDLSAYINSMMYDPKY